MSDCTNTPLTCYYKVCLTIDFNRAGCGAGTGKTISHTCEKDAQLCDGDTGFGGSGTESNIGQGYSHCQIVPAEGVAEFLIKDANAAGNCVVDDGIVPFDDQKDPLFPSSFVNYFDKNFEGTDFTVACSTYQPTGTYESCTGGGNQGKECVYRIQAPKCEKVCGVYGDPHWKTWQRKPFESQIGCDIVLVSSASFGLDVHVRTYQPPGTMYTAVEAVAIKFGDETVEINVDYQKNTGDTSLYTWNSNDREYTIALGTDSWIKVKVIDGEFLSVYVSGVENDLSDATGACGSFAKGKPYLRDGSRVDETAVTNVNDAFLKDWQVQAGEELFSTDGVEMCLQLAALKNRVATHRRLRATGDDAFLEQAREACAHREDQDLCMQDVLVTGNLALADAWGF